MKCRFVIAILATLFQTSAAEKKKSSLGQLPIGSEYLRLTIPSYDENFNVVANYTAKKIVRVSTTLFDATDVYLKHFSAEGTNPYTLEFPKATYNIKKEVLRSYHTFKATFGKSNITGTHSVINKAGEEGFIFGPINSTIYPEDIAKNKEPSSPKAITPDHTNKSSKENQKNPDSMQKKSTTLTKTAVLATTILFSDIANANLKVVTADKNRELDALRSSTSTNSANFTSAIEEKRQAVESLDHSSPKSFQKFANTYLSETQRSMLIATAEEDNKAIKINTTTPPEATNSDSEKETGLNIKSSGGFAFNAKEGTLTYMKNVIVRDPRLNLDCSESLNIYLQPEGENKEKNKSSNGNIEKIIAIGEVKFDGKKTDDKGIVTFFEGNADIIEFNYIKGTTILKGGTPYIKISKSGTVIEHKCIKQDQWILIEEDGSFTVEGGVEQIITGAKNLNK